MAHASIPRRGLILGGGGVVGGAWALGALWALKEVHGFEPRESDVIVGTSAGSMLAALFGAGATVEELLAHERGERVVSGPITGFSWDYLAVTGGSHPGFPKLSPGSSQLLRNPVSRLWRVPLTATLSAFLPTGSKSLSRMGHLIDAFTPFGEWSPHPNLWVVAVDVDTGERVVFGQPTAPPAPLALAVQASCSIPGWFEPVTIGDRRYIDGGAWSATSVDLVENMGLDEVFVIAPMVSQRFDRPSHALAVLERAWRTQVTRSCMAEVRKVRARGARVTVLGPGAEDLSVIGGNLMDDAKRLAVLQTSQRTSAAELERQLAESAVS
ncbi:MAG: patatin-like phospholipase family protein [Candidatus Nanopelagicales bacterium]